MLEVFLLIILEENPQYGGQLLEQAQNSLDETVKVSTIYAVLKRLKDNDILVEERLSQVDGITRGQSRIYYSLTNEGIEYLKSLKREINQLELVHEILNEAEDRNKEEIVR